MYCTNTRALGQRPCERGLELAHSLSGIAREPAARIAVGKQEAERLFDASKVYVVALTPAGDAFELFIVQDAPVAGRRRQRSPVTRSRASRPLQLIRASAWLQGEVDEPVVGAVVPRHRGPRREAQIE